MFGRDSQEATLATVRKWAAGCTKGGRAHDGASATGPGAKPGIGHIINGYIQASFSIFMSNTRIPL